MRGLFFVLSAICFSTAIASASPLSVAGSGSMSLDGRENPATNSLGYVGITADARIAIDDRWQARVPVSLGTIRGDETSGRYVGVGIGADWFRSCHTEGKGATGPMFCFGVGVEASWQHNAYDFKTDTSVDLDAIVVEPTLVLQRALGETRSLELRFGPRAKIIVDDKYMDRGISYGATIRLGLTQSF